jgi:hypothetical protein
VVGLVEAVQEHHRLQKVMIVFLYQLRQQEEVKAASVILELDLQVDPAAVVVLSITLQLGVPGIHQQ